jgi:transcriptional regulator with XRE-family HTH domain
MVDMKLLGQRLLLSRRDLDLDQIELAAKSGVSNTYISDLERGRTRNVSVDVVLSLADALGVSIQYLLGLTEDPLQGVADEADDEPPTPPPFSPALREVLQLAEQWPAARQAELLAHARVIHAALQASNDRYRRYLLDLVPEEWLDATQAALAAMTAGDTAPAERMLQDILLARGEPQALQEPL